MKSDNSEIDGMSDDETEKSRIFNLIPYDILFQLVNETEDDFDDNNKFLLEKNIELNWKRNYNNSKCNQEGYHEFNEGENETSEVIEGEIYIVENKDARGDNVSVEQMDAEESLPKPKCPKYGQIKNYFND